jgi:hypothetical protein
MSTKSREVIFGSRIRGAKIHADGARQAARKAVREADRAEAEAWSIRMEGYGGPAQPSPRSVNASTAATAGSRFDAIGARRKPASRSIAFGGRRTHQSGNLKPR